MMHEEIIFAGFGGQGVLFAGQLLAYVALEEQKHVTWIPSYGPEMRGGTANCTVIVADEPIGSPVSLHPSIVVAFNNPSLEKYEDDVKPGGLLIINNSLVLSPPSRTDITVISLPATAIASELGDVKLANMVLFGAMLSARPIVQMETTQAVLLEKLGARKAHLHEPNIDALERGLSLGQAQLAQT